MRAISTLRRDEGISTRACRAIVAFRMRESMSAIGSVISGLSFITSCFQLPASSCFQSKPGAGSWQPGASSPRTLRHSGDIALERQLAEAEAAERKLAHVRARTAAALAPVAQPDLELGRFSFFRNLSGRCHVNLS